MNWEKTGARPYVSKSGLVSYLEDQGYSAAKIRKALDESNADGLIGNLIQSNMIEPFAHGWIVTDGTWASSLMIQKHGAA